MIAERTKLALAAAKARGVKLGNPEQAATNRAAAVPHAEALREFVAPLAVAGQTTRAIAKALNDRGLKPPRGSEWPPLAPAGCARSARRLPVRDTNPFRPPFSQLDISGRERADPSSTPRAIGFAP